MPSPPEKPPTRPRVTAADYAALRANVQRFCKLENRTQNWLESSLGLSVGFLPKMWKGKVHFTADHLAGMCRLLGCEAMDLLAGTAFEYMLATGPADAESEAVRQLREDRDTLRVQLVAIQADRATAAGREQESRLAAQEAETRAARAEERVAELEAAARVAAAALEVSLAETHTAKATGSRLTQDLAAQRLRAENAEAAQRRLTAENAQMIKNRDEWRAFAEDRNQAATFLKSQVDALETQSFQAWLQVADAQERAAALEARAKSTKGEASFWGFAAGAALTLAAASSAQATGGRRKRT